MATCWKNPLVPSYRDLLPRLTVYLLTLFCTCSSCRGVTAVHFRDYALGCLGFIPGTVAYVFIGTTASSLLGDDDDETDDDGDSSNVQLIVIIVGAIATVIAVVLISIYAKRALNKVLEEDMEGEEERAADDAARMEGGEMATAAVGVDVGAHGKTKPLVVEHPVRSNT